jgi:DNA-binding beta-propeller fold protein YncE
MAVRLMLVATLRCTPESTISEGICEPVSLAFDSVGNLYVGNYGDDATKKPSVTVYAVGTNVLMETINHGVTKPIALAIDPSNNLYVANDTESDGVSVYPPGQESPSLKLRKGISYPLDLTLLP